MRTTHQSSAYVRPRPAGTRIRLLAASALLAGALAPLDAEVIDDFSRGRNFNWMWGTVDSPDYQLSEGQLKVSLPRANTSAVFFYQRNFEVPEGQTVEFRVDLLSLTGSDAYADLLVSFVGSPFIPRGGNRGYAFYRQQWRVALQKIWDNETYGTFFEHGVPALTVPETLVLSFTREGDRLKIGTKVVQRDDPSKVISPTRVTVDGPGSDPVNGTDPGGPPLGSVWRVGIGCWASSPNAGAVFDNLVCSADQTPLEVGLQRHSETEARLAWASESILLEATSLQGPWKPSTEEVTLNSLACNSAIRLGGPDRFFRLVPGMNVVENFDNASGRWQTASPVPGRVRKPFFRLSGGRGRILGEGPQNEEFLLRFADDVGFSYRDCVASVDVVDWDETMEDAAFGILLRVKPEQCLWFCGTEGLPREHYGGLLTFKTADNPAESALTIIGPGDASLKVQRFPALNPEKQYRLRFWAVGSRLTLEVFDLEDLETPIATCEKVDGRIVEGMSALYGTRSRSAAGRYDVTIDRFMLSGATPR